MIDNSYYYPQISRKERSKQLATLVKHFQDYDECIEDWNYSQISMHRLDQKLREPINIHHGLSFREGTDAISLCTPGRIREVLSDIDFNLGLDIRRHHAFPVYFLFRYKSESYNLHHILLEEIFRSSSYELESQRFVRLKADYHEKVFLNAIPYRQYISKKWKGRRKNNRSKRWINEHLNKISKVLNLAWDEDNDLTHQVCQQFEMRSVNAAVEVTNLILCTESFSWLRDFVPDVQDFFSEAYEHKFLGIQLQQISQMSDSSWRKRVEQAKRDYVRLRRSIVNLYRTSVICRQDGREMAFWKLAFAHYGRAIPELINDDTWIEAKQQLATEADQILDRLSG